MTRSPRELAAQKVKLQREQERLFQDLLGVMDALDHACDHWRTAEQEHDSALKASASPSAPETTLSLPQRLFQWGQHLLDLIGIPPKKTTSIGTDPTTEDVPIDSMADVLASAREGVELIQKSLLEILSQRQVNPLEAVGKPFDPEQMYALGRQEDEAAAENTVLQEVVRGYRWQNRILREAQVIVATKPSDVEDKQG
ncbi:MAG: nucleotide exchange factor GrpE [Leptolyngbyaceae cyanobacterium MO_188.B28]|nr:nucleotide exchange factor GrpE [Leptolyngbyaceae cyanobacterium MO_188.B28]